MRTLHFPFIALVLKAHHADAQSTTMQRNVEDAADYDYGHPNYEGSGQFYVNDSTQTCVRDCEPGSSLDVRNRICGGIVRESWIQLFHTVSDCCANKLSWVDPDVCVDKANPISSGTFKFYADIQNGFCRRDCEPGCVVGCQPRPPPVVLRDTIGSCCSLSLPWVDPKFCHSRSVDKFSNGWVVDWLGERCTKDCDPAHGPPCAHHKEPTEEIFNTVKHCCETFSWIDTKKCIRLSRRPRHGHDNGHDTFAKEL